MMIFRLRINLSNRINDALKSESKSDDTENLIGIPFAQFKNWIEFQFDTDMTWENMEVIGKLIMLNRWHPLI